MIDPTIGGLFKEKGKSVCRWCGRSIYPTNTTETQWYHEGSVGYWCRDETGTRRAPKP